MNKNKTDEDELAGLLEKLRFLYQSPQLFIDEYFSSLRFDIDLRTETLLQSLGQTNDKYDELNYSRECLIASLKEHELKCMVSTRERVCQSCSLSLCQTTLEQVLEIEANNEALRDRINDIIRQVSLEILLGKSFVFISSPLDLGKLGVLLGLDGCYLTESETEWVK